MPVHIHLMGLPGSGKSTQGQWLSEKLSIPFIDINERIKGVITDSQDLVGNTWKEVYDDLAVDAYLGIGDGDCVIEGFPRDINHFKHLLPEKRYSPWEVAVNHRFLVTPVFIYLAVQENISWIRSVRLGNECVEINTWEARLSLETQRLYPLIDRYEKTRIYYINGQVEPVVVFKNILNTIKNLVENNQATNDA